MDPTRFDALSRALTTLNASHPSRRALFPILGGLLAASLGRGPEAVAKRRKRKCRGPNANKTLCLGAGGGCKDLTSDPAHCGLCFRACGAGETCDSGRCSGGECTPNCDGATCGADDGCGGRCFQGSCPDGQTCGGGGTPNECGTGECTPSCGDKQCGTDGCNGSCGTCPQGQICRDNGTCVPGGGGGGCNPACGFNQECQNGTCVAAANRCSPGFVCSGFGGDPPVCGTVAGNPGGPCGCVPSTEGNNVCINQTDSDGDFILADTLVTCDSSQQCRDTVGFHFYCRKPLQNENGLFCGDSIGRCWPECDNPSTGFAHQERRGKHKTSRSRRKRSH